MKTENKDINVNAVNEVKTLQQEITDLLSKPSSAEGYNRTLWTTTLLDLVNAGKFSVIEQADAILITISDAQYKVSVASLLLTALAEVTNTGEFAKVLENLQDGFLTSKHRTTAKNKGTATVDARVWDFTTGYGFSLPEIQKGGNLKMVFSSLDKDEFLKSVNALNVVLMDMGYNPAKPQSDSVAKQYFIETKKAKVATLDIF